jgi:hypothetical protein
MVIGAVDPAASQLCAGKPMATAAQARAVCLAQGTPADACDEMIRDKSLDDGTFCDGELLTSVGPSGQPVKTCTPDCVVQAKLALLQIPPQPTAASGAQKVAIAVVGAAIIAGAVYWYTR